MGIRFRCHHCQVELHVKDFQAGRRGRCPECGGKFRIPAQDAEFSLDAAEQPQSVAQPESSPKKVQASKAAEVEKPTRAVPNAATLAIDNAVESDTALQAAATSSNAATQAAAPVDIPQALREAPAGVWYVRPTSGGQYGPATSEAFMQWLIEGRVSRDALVWRDDWPEWQVAGQRFSDYFGPPLPDEIATLAAHSPAVESGALPIPAADQPSDRRRIGRRQQRRRNYRVMLAILTVVFICLMVALIVVLSTPAT